MIFLISIKKLHLIKRVLAVCLMVFALMCVGILLGYAVFGPPKANAMINEAEEAQKTDDEYRLYLESFQRAAEDSLCEWNYRYQLCGHAISETKPLPQACVGMDKKALETYFGYKVEYIDNDGVRLAMDIPSYCPNHIVLKNNGVRYGLYRNILGTEIMSQIRDVDLKSSPKLAEMRQMLEIGMAFDSLEDLDMFLQEHSQ